MLSRLSTTGSIATPPTDGVEAPASQPPAAQPGQAASPTGWKPPSDGVDAPPADEQQAPLFIPDPDRRAVRRADAARSEMMSLASLWSMHFQPGLDLEDYAQAKQAKDDYLEQERRAAQPRKRKPVVTAEE